jgi:hypothetical protein
MNALSLEQINTISLFTEKACRPDKQRDFRHLLKTLSVLSAFMLKFNQGSRKGECRWPHPVHSGALPETGMRHTCAITT